MTRTEPKPYQDVDPEDAASIPSVESYLISDRRRAPEILLERTEPARGTEPVPVDDYISPERARLEEQCLWTRVWQMAGWAADITEPGDFFEYTVGRQSIIVVRQPDGSVRAFHNACRHRGSRLLEGCGHAEVIQCRFHNWAWATDGSLSHVPCRWDFPQVSEATHGLAEVAAGEWNGFVFVNLDPDAPPLEEYLGETIPRHFQRWPNDHRLKAMHIVQDVPANWKVALEAFLELYHTAGTHPQITPYAGGVITQYDRYGPHARMVGALGVPDPRSPEDLTEQDIVDAMVGDLMAAEQIGNTQGQADNDGPVVPDGGTARATLAEWNRQRMGARTGVDYSGASDSEMLDVIQYFVFPNFLVWGSRAAPIVHRVRPAADPNHCLFETIVLVELPDGVPAPPSPPVVTLAEGVSLTTVPGIAGPGFALDQDIANMGRVQAGLHSLGLREVTFSREQEGNIRAFHQLIDGYLAPGAA